MKKLETYNPFNTKDYYIVEENGKKYFSYNDILLELCSSGYIPKSGLLFDKVLNTQICNGKSVLDLGCGYLGILGMIARANGARLIDSIDYDEECVKWFNKIIKDNNLKNIRCFTSNYFDNVTSLYDLILSNPPQMPMLKGSLHDSGGIDGRKYILEVIKQSFLHLKNAGELYILLFDFLGTLERTNNEQSLLEIAKDIGYSSVSLMFECQKNIRKGSVTFDNLTHINSIYPLYEFGTDDKKCGIQIVKMKK